MLLEDAEARRRGGHVGVEGGQRESTWMPLKPDALEQGGRFESGPRHVRDWELVDAWNPDSEDCPICSGFLGVNEDGKKYWESKAAQCGYWKLTHGQTTHNIYDSMMSTDYVLWAYHGKHRTPGGLGKAFSTVGDLVQYVVKTIRTVHVVPLKTLQRLLKEKETRERKYRGWKDVHGNGYHVYQLPLHLLEKWRWSTNHTSTKLRSLSVSYFGTRFVTNIFPVVYHADIGDSNGVRDNQDREEDNPF